VSMWCSQGRYNTLHVITDGGDGNNIRMYAWGNNNGHQQAANVAIAHGASATAQGVWFGNECQFMQAQDGTSAIRASVTTRLIGDPCIVYTGGTRSATATGFNAMLDSNGQLWLSGNWMTHNPSTYTEPDNEVDFTGTEDSPIAWQMCHGQPEKIVSVCFGSDTDSEEGWVFVGESGLMYVGGYDGFSQAGGVVSNSFNIRRMSH
jgi:hypothetical protein